MNTEQFIEKTLGLKSVSDREKIDRLLEYDTNMYTNLGTDSTKAERDAVKVASRKIYRAIKFVDRGHGELLLRAFD